MTNLPLMLGPIFEKLLTYNEINVKTEHLILNNLKVPCFQSSPPQWTYWPWDNHSQALCKMAPLLTSVRSGRECYKKTYWKMHRPDLMFSAGTEQFLGGNLAETKEFL